MELLSQVLQLLDLSGLFALAMTCKGFYGRILDRQTFTYAIKCSMTKRDGPMHWMYPVVAMRKEWEEAVDRMMGWLPKEPFSVIQYTLANTEFDDNDDINDHDYVPDVDLEVDDTSDDSSSSDSSSNADSDAEILEAGDSSRDTLPILDVPVPLPPNPDEVPLRPLPLFDPTFPLLAFLKAYIGSDAMLSRRRRWRIIKQFDVLFTNYRRDGWERDDFVPGRNEETQGINP